MRGLIEEAIRNLEDGIQERLNLYSAQDEGVWLISKMLTEIALKMAAKAMNVEKMDKAQQFLKMARKHTEPLPNSNWAENKQWRETRRNVFKNLAIFYQK